MLNNQRVVYTVDVKKHPTVDISNISPTLSKVCIAQRYTILCLSWRHHVVDALLSSVSIQLSLICSIPRSIQRSNHIQPKAHQYLGVLSSWLDFPSTSGELASSPGKYPKIPGLGDHQRAGHA